MTTEELDLVAIRIPKSALRHRVPKRLFNVRDAEHALGGPEAVRKLRAAGILVPVASGPILFSAESIEDAALHVIQNGLPANGRRPARE